MHWVMIVWKYPNLILVAPCLRQRYVVVDIGVNTYFVCSRYDCGFTDDIKLADTFISEEAAMKCVNNQYYINKTKNRNLRTAIVWKYV